MINSEIEKKASILLVIPEYNDYERLKPYLKDLMKELDSEYEIQIVDDGSPQKEQEKIVKLPQTYTQTTNSPKLLKPITYKRNKGKGGAIKTGLLNHKGYHQILGFVDADGAIPPSEIIKLVNIIKNQKDLEAIFGCRSGENGTSVHRSWTRELSSRTFSTAIRLITKTKIRDTQCGLKFFKNRTYELLRPHLENDRFAIDIEMCVFLEKMGATIREEPINWTEIDGSRVKIWRDSLPMINEAYKIIKRSRKYEK
jgi:dolichyl-phosphate beta-glucosyltransferase